MTAFLPPNLLALFAARDPIPYLPPASKLGHEKKRLSHGGVAVFIKDFEDPKDTPPPTRVETKDERKERKRKERAEQIAYKLEQDLALWNPNDNPMGTGDPYKTLFVARINYDTSESKLRREFEVYGPVRKISLLNDKMTGKPRGYAFIEYEHERDMHCKSRDTSVTRSKFKVVYWHLKMQDIDPAYKHADGKKIDGRRVLVDVERGRTVKGWRPRRLGGGLGGTRKGGPDENTRFSGRDEYSGSYRDRSGREESPGRDRRRRSRSRERERERRRSRSRERRRSRSREDKDRKRGARRSRSRERDRERKRSRSRDRKRARRSRSRDRRDRDRDDKRGEEGGEGQEYGEDGVVVKEEAEDAYEGYEGGYGGEDQNGYQNEQESYDR